MKNMAVPPDMNVETATEHFYTNCPEQTQPLTLNFIATQTALQTACGCPAIQSFDGFSIEVKDSGKLVASASGTIYRAIPVRAFPPQSGPAVVGFDADLDPVVEWMTENVGRLSHFPTYLKSSITQVFIATLFVDAKYRRQGIGSAVLDFLQSRFSPYAVCAWDWGGQKDGKLVPVVAAQKTAGATVEVCRGAHLFLEKNGLKAQKLVRVASIGHDVALMALCGRVHASAARPARARA